MRVICNHISSSLKIRSKAILYTTAILLTTAMLPAAVAFLSGCTEKPDKAEITFSGPSGLTLQIDRTDLGAAPAMVKLKPGRYLMKFAAPGFQRKWEFIDITDLSPRRLQVELAPETSSVLIATKPVGAELWVDGKVLGATPLVLDNVVAGREYSGQLRLPGYSEREVRWSVDSARPRQVLIDLDANTVMINLKTRPEKARLSIDGRTVGTTPYQGELTAGKYQLRFELEGYITLEQSITLNRGEKFEQEYLLAIQPGGVSVTSLPEGAEIFIGDRKRGVTPCTLTDLTPGIYDIRAEKEGYDSVIQTVEITSGFQDDIRMVLLPNTGELELLVRPAGVLVVVDGREIGLSENSDETTASTKPIRIGQLSPGRHTVTVSHPQASPSTRDITVEVEKGKLSQPRPIDVWIANCEIKYRDGRVEIGALYQETGQTILFGPEPGVRVELNKSDFESIRKLNIQNAR